MTRTISLFILLLVFLLAGCATMRIDKRVDVLWDELNQMIGKNETEVVWKYGPPLRKYEQDGYVFLSYRIRYDNQMIYSGSNSGVATNIEEYDDLLFLLQNKKVRKWKAIVKRGYRTKNMDSDGDFLDE